MIPSLRADTNQLSRYNDYFYIFCNSRISQKQEIHSQQAWLDNRGYWLLLWRKFHFAFKNILKYNKKTAEYIFLNNFL